MNIIAFDLGSNFAMAHNACGVPVVEHKTFTGPRAHRAGATLLYLQRRLLEVEQAGLEISAAVYELPFARGRDATRCLWGIAGLIEAACTNAGMAVVDATPGEIKTFTTGNAKASKEDMIVAAQALGYTGDNEHEADAYCLLKYAERYVFKTKDIT